MQNPFPAHIYTGGSGGRYGRLFLLLALYAFPPKPIRFFFFSRTYFFREVVIPATKQRKTCIQMANSPNTTCHPTCHQPATRKPQPATH